MAPPWGTRRDPKSAYTYSILGFRWLPVARYGIPQAEPTHHHSLYIHIEHFVLPGPPHTHPPVPHRARGSPIPIVKTPTYLPPSKSVNDKNWRTPVLSMKSACTTLHRLQGARCGDTAPPRSRGPSHSPFPGVLTRCQAPLGRESLPPRAKNRCHTLPLSVCTDST